MISSKYFSKQFKSAEIASDPLSFTFKYDCNGDEDCNISDEILSEKSNALEHEMKSMCNISTHSSPFDIKSPIENLKCKSNDDNIIRSERKIAFTMKNNNKINDNASSVLVKTKPTDVNHAQQNLTKSLNMKESITEMLKILVIKRKKQENLVKSIKLLKNDVKTSFITMKDICLSSA